MLHGGIGAGAVVRAHPWGRTSGGHLVVKHYYWIAGGVQLMQIGGGVAGGHGQEPFGQLCSENAVDYSTAILFVADAILWLLDAIDYKLIRALLDDFPDAPHDLGH